MVSRFIEQLHDDINGNAGATRHTLILNNSAVELDLDEANFLKLQEMLAPWLAAGRPIAARRTKMNSKHATPKNVRPAGAVVRQAGKPAAEKLPTQPGAAPKEATISGTQRALIREWAKRMRRPVAERGRLAQTIVDEYFAAQNGDSSPAAPLESTAAPAEQPAAVEEKPKPAAKKTAPAKSAPAKSIPRARRTGRKTTPAKATPAKSNGRKSDATVPEATFQAA